MDKKVVYILVAVVGLLVLGGGLWVRQKNSSGVAMPGEPLPTISAAPSQTPTGLPDEAAATISGEWTWTKTQMNDGKVTTPNKIGAFVATFEDSGQVSSTTDCNSLAGTYKLLPDNGIEFSQFASTLMYCEGSQEQQYSAWLSSANSYKISGNELWLMLPYDSGTMIFVRS